MDTFLEFGTPKARVTSYITVGICNDDKTPCNVLWCEQVNYLSKYLNCLLPFDLNGHKTLYGWNTNGINIYDMHIYVLIWVKHGSIISLYPLFQYLVIMSHFHTLYRETIISGTLASSIRPCR